MSFVLLRKWLGVELVEVSFKERFVAAVGGGMSILALVVLTFWALPEMAATAVITSMGASAVLLFAVPHGQLSQPWPVVGGHVVSALIGVACAKVFSYPPLAAAVAVGLAIGAMHQFKCIHPPGGATAFTAAMGSVAIRDLGFGFVLFPVLSNALTMVSLAMLFNGAFPWRRYPAILARPARTISPPAGMAAHPSPTHAEVLAALRSLNSFVDISEEDLLRLVKILSAPAGPPSGRKQTEPTNPTR